MKEIIVLGGKLYVQEKANNIIAKDGALYACDYEPDPNPENWRTINGAKVHINNEGYIDGGAGGKFNGNGAVPRSMFPDTDSAERRKQKKEAEQKAKAEAEQHKKEVETAREQRKQERAEAAKLKKEKEAQMKLERAELKPKFDEMVAAYHAEKDPKKKKAILKELDAFVKDYKSKYGISPADDKIKAKKKELATKNGKSDVGEKGLAYLRSISHVNSSAEEETGYTARTMIDMINKGKTMEEIRTELRKNIDKYSHDTDNDYRHLDKMIEAVKRADKGESRGMAGR